MALTSAQQTIVVNNLPFANRIASQFFRSNPDIPSDDIRGAAYEGLCIAADTYDPACGTKFTTYAFRAILNTLKQLAKDYGTRLYSAETVERIFLISIDNYFDCEGDCTLDLPDTSDSDRARQAAIQGHVQRALQLLSPRQRTIVAHYYGLDGHKPLNIRSIAKKLSVSEDTVSRQLQKALNTLKITL